MLIVAVYDAFCLFAPVGLTFVSLPLPVQMVVDTTRLFAPPTTASSQSIGCVAHAINDVAQQLGRCVCTNTDQGVDLDVSIALRHVVLVPCTSRIGGIFSSYYPSVVADRWNCKPVA